MSDHICPWWLAYTFDNPLRALIHDPKRIFGPYLRPGMTVADIGCGMGYFSIGLAKILEGSSRIIAVDMQQEMLEVARKRAVKKGVSEAITFLHSRDGKLDLERTVDLAITFWMLHETLELSAFIAQIHMNLSKQGLLFIAEPKFHVSKKQFDREIKLCLESGFTIRERPDIAFSHSMLLERESG